MLPYIVEAGSDALEGRGLEVEEYYDETESAM